MKNSKKKDWLGVALFVAVTFAICYGCYFLAQKTAKTDENMASLFTLVLSFSPAIACVLTRLVMREGFRNIGLLPTFRGHFKGYALAVLIPLAFGIFAAFCTAIFLGSGFTLKTGSFKDLLLSMLLGSDMIYGGILVMLGEELGWRGYLYERLEKLCGSWGSILIGGTIWGLWHAPFVIEGGNFGKTGPGMPYMGVFLMCISCIMMGALFVWIYKLTGSVWGACVCHGAIDYVASGLMTMFLTPELVVEKIFTIGVSSLIVAVIPFFGLSIYGLMKQNNRK